MTKVALYARYSSDNQSIASIEDQFRICCTWSQCSCDAFYSCPFKPAREPVKLSAIRISISPAYLFRAMEENAAIVSTINMERVREFAAADSSAPLASSRQAPPRESSGRKFWPTSPGARSAFRRFAKRRRLAARPPSASASTPILPLQPMPWCAGNGRSNRIPFIAPPTTKPRSAGRRPTPSRRRWSTARSRPRFGVRRAQCPTDARLQEGTAGPEDPGLSLHPSERRGAGV